MSPTSLRHTYLVAPLGEEGNNVCAAARHSDDDLGDVALAPPRPPLRRLQQLGAQPATLGPDSTKNIFGLKA